MSNKKKLDAYGTMSLFENCSDIIQKKLPKNSKTQVVLLSLCIIGEHTLSKELCDLRASFNLMPLLVAKKLNLGEITPTSLSLQMATGQWLFQRVSLKKSLLKLMNLSSRWIFFVLDMEKDREAPLILGTSFLATSQTLIDVKNGELTLRVGEDQVNFNFYKSMN